MFTLALSSLWAVPLTVANPSFESHEPFGFTSGLGSWNHGPIPGWVQPAGDSGSFQIAPSYMTTPDGLLSVWTHDGGIVAQNLSAAVTPGLTYTLIVAVGTEPGYSNNGYAVRLLAGNQILAEDNTIGTPSGPTGWYTSTVTYISPIGDIYAGQNLRIELEGTASEVVFDHVRLSDSSVNAVPEPGTVSLLGFACAFALLLNIKRR